jgi:hypothetical protein
MSQIFPIIVLPVLQAPQILQGNTIPLATPEPPDPDPDDPTAPEDPTIQQGNKFGIIKIPGEPNVTQAEFYRFRYKGKLILRFFDLTGKDHKAFSKLEPIELLKVLKEKNSKFEDRGLATPDFTVTKNSDEFSFQKSNLLEANSWTNYSHILTPDPKLIARRLIFNFQLVRYACFYNRIEFSRVAAFVRQIPDHDLINALSTTASCLLIPNTSWYVLTMDLSSLGSMLGFKFKDYSQDVNWDYIADRTKDSKIIMYGEKSSPKPAVDYPSCQIPFMKKFVPPGRWLHYWHEHRVRFNAPHGKVTVTDIGFGSDTVNKTATGKFLHMVNMPREFYLIDPNLCVSGWSDEITNV